MNDYIQIGDVTPRVQILADGSLTEFSNAFPIFVPDDLEVYVDDIWQSAGYAIPDSGSLYGGAGDSRRIGALS